jgi:DNA-binding LacI/PurR family transcriptional regulator
MEAVTHGGDWAAGAHIAAQQLLSPSSGARPTALFATNDLLAIGAMRAIRDGRIIDAKSVCGLLLVGLERSL